ncbi:MAG: glycosyltransferase family 4 protein [Magnetococcales bacterium]|nr:glycosyltransferase family 4 protein [Magnetococcales bacterium]
MTSVILIVAVAFLLSAGLSYYLAHPTARLLRIIDHPNQRSLHAHPTPRGGGLAILCGFVCSWLLLGAGSSDTDWGWAGWVGAGLLTTAVLSLLDDLYQLSAALRLTVHLTTAALVIEYGQLLPDHSWLPAPLWLLITVLAMVWMMNLYNFMDGMDGFAASMAVIGFGYYALFGWIAQQPLFSLTALLLASASAGFLLFNKPPARLFMGDVGSLPLGFMVAVLSLWGLRDALFPWWVPLLVFAVFIVDATVTLLRRTLRGEAIWQAHRSHYYQKMVIQHGWSHGRTVAAESILMLTSGGSAFWWMYSGGTTSAALLLTAWSLLLALLAYQIDRKS